MNNHTYFIEVIEVLSTIVKVEADNEGEAFAKIKNYYEKELIVLNSEHHISTEFQLNGCIKNPSD